MNTEIDSEKRIEALEKANSALEHTNFELQAKVVQLEVDLKACNEQFAKQQQQHEAQLTQVQTHAQQQIAAAKALSSSDEGSVDWIKCEELVEKLLLTGDLPREQLESDDLDEDEDDERVYARKLHQEVAQELKKLGMEYAIACLSVMKENLFFASNTAVELQDMMSKQSLTVEFLEKRLHEQKREAEQMKLQIQHLTEGSQDGGDSVGKASGPATMIPRSKSHSGAVSKRSNRTPSRPNSSRDNSSSVQDFGGMEYDSDSDSDSDKDSETSTHSRSQYNQRQQMIQGGNRSTKASSQGGQSTMTLLIAPLGAGENGYSTRSLRTQRAGGDQDASVAESHHRSSHDESSRDNSSSSFKDNAIRNGTLPDNTSDSGGSSTTSTAANPPLKSGSDMIRKRMELLKNGSLFVKYGRFGKPHVRFVWCSADLEYLNYRTISKQAPKASIPTRSITRIHLGQATKVFERAKQEARKPFCFSVEYEDNRTLDLEVSSLMNWLALVVRLRETNSGYLIS